MTKEVLLNNIADIKSKCATNRLNKVLKEKYPDIYSEICNLTDSICTSNNPSIIERLYIIEHNITDKKTLVCPVCKNNFRKFKFNKYTDVCSRTCHNKSDIVKQKIKNSRILHYGCYVSKEILEKKQKTCLKRYGVSSYSKLKEFKEKSRKTKLERYGSETYNNTSQMLQTKEQLYGTKSYNNIEKIKKTFNQRYGVNSPVQIPEVQKKQQETCLKKYGVKSFLQTESCNQQSKTRSYEKMLNNEYDIPVFSYDDYLKIHGDNVLKFRCKKCNNVFEALHHDGYHSKCPICYPYVPSISQNEINDFISNYIEILKNTRKIIAPLELDIYIPTKKLAIEFDGLYWHSTNVHNDKNYHLHKTEECEKKGIQLIHVFENEWLHKQDIVKSRIKNLLGIYDKTIFARKCEVRAVNSNISIQFQNDNHIQGNVNAKINLGLYYKNELISLMTFGKCRFDKKHEWELLRFCNKLGYHIPGAASKLLKHFERICQPKSLVSYADRRWSQGKVYKALGFKLDHISKPNYWYVKGTSIESRMKYQKHKLHKLLNMFDINKSEVENMQFNGFYQIYDCGNLVFVKDYKNEIA